MVLNRVILDKRIWKFPIIKQGIVSWIHFIIWIREILYNYGLKKSITVLLYSERFMSFKYVRIYGLMFRILTRFHALYFGASCIHRNSMVWRRVNLARFPYWPEKWTRRISRYSYLMKTLISSEYGLTIFWSRDSAPPMAVGEKHRLL